MKAQTEAAVRNILAMDEEVEKDNIERCISILRGQPQDKDLIQVIRYKEALKHLQCHRRTLEYYIQKGYLKRVYGGGERAIGISRESFIRFTQLRVVGPGAAGRT